MLGARFDLGGDRHDLHVNIDYALFADTAAKFDHLFGHNVIDGDDALHGGALLAQNQEALLALSA